jgi:hypothetical protein
MLHDMGVEHANKKNLAHGQVPRNEFHPLNQSHLILIDQEASTTKKIRHIELWNFGGWGTFLLFHEHIMHLLH